MGDDSDLWEAEASVLMTHEVGLHARPSVKLTQVAKGFTARIEVGLGSAGPWIDAKSIVKVMRAKAPQNTVLYFRASGGDAEAAVAALVALVEDDFAADLDGAVA
ncbi:MAG: HPr family phosphocarrier protein [Rhodospirillales bacterium]